MDEECPRSAFPHTSDPGAFVIADLDTLLIALYVELVDRIIPACGTRRRGPGRPPVVTDAELVCLAGAQVLLRYHQEHHWLRAAPSRVGHLFPRLLGQSEYNQPLKDAAPLMEAALRWLAEHTPARRSCWDCWTARRSAAASPRSPPSALTCSATPATAMSPRTAATTGASSSCSSGPPTAPSLGSPWPTPSCGASGSRPGSCWPTRPPTAPPRAPPWSPTRGWLARIPNRCSPTWE